MNVAEEIAAAIVARIPALRSLDEVARASGRIVASGSVIQFELQALVPIEAIEKAYVLHVLKSVGGNRTRAAEVLGFDPATLYRKLNRWREE